jgi:UDP-glucuronate decarboxylase
MGFRESAVENMVDTYSKRRGVVNSDLDYMLGNLAGEFSRLAGKKILITGGAGFLGYYFVLLIDQWNKSVQQDKKILITVYDNFMRGIQDWLKHLGNNEYINTVQRDIVKPVDDTIGSFEYIIHAASIASPIYYRKYPIETMDANVQGVRNLLEYARHQIEKRKPVEGFLFFSTSEIYGDPDSGNIPTPETYRGNVSCTGPRACYDESKRYGETLCVNFARQYGIPVTIARPFNNYGPGLKITDKRVIPDFANNILKNNDIVMYSDGKPTRTFCYVADAIVGYYKILTRGRAGEAYNIGVSEPEISMTELAELMASIASEEFGYTGTVVHRISEDAEYLTDNPNRRCPDIGKAGKELGYVPNISLQDGLRKTLLWYREDLPAAY